MPTVIHNGHCDAVKHGVDPVLIEQVITRLDTDFGGRRDRQALDASATDVLDGHAYAAGDTHTPTPREVDVLVAAVRARIRGGAA
ncbi:hypothetical protein [Amycolatopsis coloradensis]|nr:hypothetical protein [Amycolatopsis coloradensis]